jgi:hypothetical protein
MCSHEPSCQDRHCPGHPTGAANQLLALERLHRITSITPPLHNRDGSATVENGIGVHKDYEPWTFAQLLLGGFIAVVLLASLAWAVYANRQVIAYAIGQVLA